MADNEWYWLEIPLSLHEKRKSLSIVELMLSLCFKNVLFKIAQYKLLIPSEIHIKQVNQPHLPHIVVQA